MLDAAQSAVILSAVAAVLQGTSAHADEQSIQPSTAPTSDLLDFASLPPAVHSPSPALGLGGEAQGLQFHDHAAAQPIPLHNAQYLVTADAKIADGMVAPAIAHAVVVDSLPLVAVLWDLPAHRPVTKSISDDGALPSATPTSSAAASSAALASPTSHAAVPILSVKLVANSQADDSLPVVQATKITYPGSQGTTVDTHTQLANALSNALKESAHATIDAGSLGLPGGSAANALASSLTDHSNGSSDNASTTSSSKTIPTAGTTSVDKTTATNKAPADKAPSATDKAPSATDKAPAATDKVPTATDKAPTATDKTTPPTDPSSAQHSQDVTLFVRDFLAHTNDWSLIQNDKSVIIYDAAAVSADPGHLQSFTFDFSDGSTLSLVGLPAAFPHGLFAA
jgi:hypothetical protein